MNEALYSLAIFVLIYIVIGIGLRVISYFSAKRFMKGKNDTPTSQRS
jgi:hypothetical protein